jgi:LemA protein
MNVLVFGTFDGLHPGHRSVLDAAALRGMLHVVVARDTNVERIKGRPPLHDEEERRASLIERLASLVKEYAKHESETFKQVAKARSAVDTSQSTKEAAKAENMLTDTLRSLFAVSESYPKLQANANYADLQSQLEETENLIAQYREQYNVTVQQYNNLIQVFPNLIPAAVFKFAEEDFFDTKS